MNPDVPRLIAEIRAAKSRAFRDSLFEQLIEILEGPDQIRAAAIELADTARFALDEWFKKTEWVQEQISTFPISSLGKHRADVMREEIERLRAARPVADAGEAVAWWALVNRTNKRILETCDTKDEADRLMRLAKLDPTAHEVVPLYRAAPSARTLSEDIPAEFLFAFEKHCCKNPAWIKHAWREAVALLAATATPAEASGPRFTDERPDILHALYRCFQRGDSVERVHFDICQLLKASKLGASAGLLASSFTREEFDLLDSTMKDTK